VSRLRSRKSYSPRSAFHQDPVTRADRTISLRRKAFPRERDPLRGGLHHLVSFLSVLWQPPQGSRARRGNLDTDVSWPLLYRE